MIIKLSPVFSDQPALDVSVVGDVVTVNGKAFDFTPIPSGYSLPLEAIGSQLFNGPAVRDLDGILTITLIFPHPSYADEAMRFPEPINVLKDGTISLPSAPVPTQEELKSNGLEPATES